MHRASTAWWKLPASKANSRARGPTSAKLPSKPINCLWSGLWRCHHTTSSTNEPQADLLFVLAMLNNHRRFKAALHSGAPGRGNKLRSHDFIIFDGRSWRENLETLQSYLIYSVKKSVVYYPVMLVNHSLIISHERHNLTSLQHLNFLGTEA